MKVTPLTPGIYICHFNHNVDWNTVKTAIISLNEEANPFGIHFIPEKADCYQILNQEQKED